MNSVEIVGRLTRDPEIKYTPENSTAFCRFGVAVQRPFKNSSGQYDADFIECVAYRGTAEFVSKYFHKGDPIGLNGSIRTGSYEKDGRTVYTTNVNVNNVEFVGSRNSTGNNNNNNNNNINFPDMEANLPFN